MKMYFTLTATVFVMNYQYVGGSVLRVGQVIERMGLKYKISFMKTTEMHLCFLVKKINLYSTNIIK